MYDDALVWLACGAVVAMMLRRCGGSLAMFCWHLVATMCDVALGALAFCAVVAPVALMLVVRRGLLAACRLLGGKLPCSGLGFMVARCMASAGEAPWEQLEAGLAIRGLMPSQVGSGAAHRTMSLV